MAKRILFLTPEFPPSPGGIGNHGYNLINSLSKMGYDVRVLTGLGNSSAAEAKKIQDDCKFSITYVKEQALFPVQSRRILKAFYIMFRFKPEVVLCSGRFSFWIGRLLMLFYKSPQFICIIHGNVSSKERYRFITRASLKGFKTLVSVSAFTQSFIQPKYRHQTHVVIPNAIDMEDLLPYKLLQKKKLKGNPALLTVGNVTLRKGQQNVIKALPEILKLYPEAHYHCVGLDSRTVENSQLAKELKVDKHVTFHGKLSKPELMAAYNGCDVFLMMSETQPNGDFEGFGIAILEANFFGKPAIGSAGCGIEDAIDHGKTGYKVANNNPTEITEAVKGILSDYKAMSNEAVKWATKHNWDEVAERYIKLFNR